VTRKIDLHPEARLELIHAEDWYEERQSGLGLRLRRDVRAVFDRIVQFPHGYEEHLYGTRKAVVSDFPFVLIYRPTDQVIQVFAIAHTSRKPGHWKERLSSL
jgi:plasmid stabilization system protein ParE